MPMRARVVPAAVLVILLLASTFAHAFRLCGVSRDHSRVASSHCSGHPGASGHAAGSQPDRQPRCCDPSVVIAAIPGPKASVAGTEARLRTPMVADVPHVRHDRSRTSAHPPSLGARWAPHRFDGVRDHLAHAILLI